MKKSFSARRPLGRLFYFLLALAIAALTARLDAQGPQTTQISDIVYRSNGTPAQGTILISWPNFTTADLKAVAAGRLTVTIGTGGTVSIALVPNAGSNPAGTYYKITFQLDDGTSGDEYWSVPATGPTTIAAIRSRIVPSGVAMQVASRQYVDEQVLLKASDSAVLHRSGDETATGVKTLTGALQARNLNDIRLANQFSGASIDAKQTACFADFTTGLCVFTPSIGSWALLSTAVPNDKTLLDLRDGVAEWNTSSTEDFVNKFRFEVGLNPASNTTLNQFGQTTEVFSYAANTKNFGGGGQMTAVYGSANHMGTGSANTVAGVVGEGFNQGSGTTTLVRGIYGTANCGGPHAGNPDQTATNNGACTNLRAAGGVVRNTSSGVVTNGTGFYIEAASNTGGGSITNNHGIFVADQTAGVNNWAFKSGLGLFQVGDSAQFDKTAAIGTAPVTTVGFMVRPVSLTSTTQTGMQVAGVATSAATVQGFGIRSRMDTAVAAYTMGINSSFFADNPTLGAGSAITTLSGYNCATMTSGATNFCYRNSGNSNNDFGTGTSSGTIFNAITGFRIGGAAASNTFLKGNGTNYVSGSPVLASADFANQGTATTLLHGNAAGNPSFGSVVSADLNLTPSTCTNQFLSAISATGTGTCTTDTLASAQHANQGTTTTVLHGNAAGNPSFAGVTVADATTTTGTGTNFVTDNGPTINNWVFGSSALQGGAAAGVADINGVPGGASIVRLQRSGGTGGVQIYQGNTTTVNWSINDAAAVSMTGVMAKYNNLATTGAGMPAIYGTAINLATQAAAITATTILASGTNPGAGMYRICYYASVTRAATTSSTLGPFALSVTDATVVKTLPRTNVAGVNQDTTNTTATAISGCYLAKVDASTNIQYTMGYTSAGATTMQFDLSIKLEFLGI